MTLLSIVLASLPSEVTDSLVNNLSNSIGMDMFEEEIDDVIFQTNQFLTDAQFIGPQGPFWWILEMCMALAAMFAIIMAAGEAYKMMVKQEAFNFLKILRTLGIALIMFCWYPGGMAGQASVVGVLSYIPNCIGSYTHDLYEAEAFQVQQKFDDLAPKIKERDAKAKEAYARIEAAKKGQTSLDNNVVDDAKTAIDNHVKAEEASFSSMYAGILVFADKLIMLLAMIIYRVGWWGTIYVQQILLGMLTIFGPIQIAFSVLPKWEGAWAKWVTRYLTVHFYGAMLYFVGFYVLLLFDIVLSIQYENLAAILASDETFSGYLQNTIMTAGYLLVASVVSLKCLNLVPDLAAWMIPEGDTAFSTRNFGEGVASGAQSGIKSFTSKLI